MLDRVWVRVGHRGQHPARGELATLVDESSARGASSSKRSGSLSPCPRARGPTGSRGVRSVPPGHVASTALVTLLTPRPFMRSVPALQQDIVVACEIRGPYGAFAQTCRLPRLPLCAKVPLPRNPCRRPSGTPMREGRIGPRRAPGRTDRRGDRSCRVNTNELSISLAAQCYSRSRRNGL